MSSMQSERRVILIDNGESGSVGHRSDMKPCKLL